jgi:putative ABC transport system substrate-binding protein
MKRRELITLLGGAAAWPMAVRAQQPTLPVIGYLYSGMPESSAHLLAAFRKGLSEAGFVEGRNVAIEYRWGQNDANRLPDLAAELVRRRVAVIVAPGSTSAALAAKAATTIIPIVFSSGGDPVQAGLVPRLNRPGGNITGVSLMNVELSAKRLGLLQELLPGASRFAALVNPNDPAVESLIADVRSAATAIGRQIETFYAGTNRDIDIAFATLLQKRADALLVSPGPFFSNRRIQIVSLTTRHALPTIFSNRNYTDVGGLMSYGPNVTDLFRQVGVYAGRVLKGEKPADLPVQQPTKFELVINLQAAKTLAIEVPPSLLARADEVIE